MPVVATRVDGLTEVVDDGVSGYLVSPGNTGELAARIIELLRDADKARQFGRRGCERVKQYYSIDNYNSSIIAFYDRYIR